MAIYTYPVHGIGFSPDPNNVQDHDTIEDAYAAFIDDVETTCEQLEIDYPSDVPTIDDVRRAMPAGIVYARGGWLHVIGQD